LNAKAIALQSSATKYMKKHQPTTKTNCTWGKDQFKDLKEWDVYSTNNHHPIRIEDKLCPYYECSHCKIKLSK
jgi:hypothetical protein